MKITIVGSNALASLWAGMLAKKKHTVYLVLEDQEVINVITKQKGLLMKVDQEEKECLCPVNATNSISEAIALGSDCLIVMTPTNKVQEMFGLMGEDLANLINSNVVVCTFQHGLGNVKAITGHVPKNNVLFGITVTHANILRDGLIRGTANRPSNVWSGSGVLSEEMKKTIKVFNDAGLPTTATPEAEIMLWKKLAVNCSINPVCGICGLKTGPAWNDANNSGRTLMLEIAKEVAQVAQLEGVKLTEQETIDAVTFVAQKASNHVAEMCNDILNQRETDIDNLNGFILDCAKKHNLKVPATQHVYLLVKLIQQTHGKRLKPLIKSNPLDEPGDVKVTTESTI